MAVNSVLQVPKSKRSRSRGAAPAPADGKLVRPNPGAEALERPRLIQALAAHAHRPLILVVADGGYGKTHALATYTRTLRHPSVWYSLKPSDADLVVFSRCLLAGFRREFPRFGRAFERAIDEVKPGDRAAEMLAGTFATALAELRAPAIVAVLDDYQEVASHPQVATFVATLLRDMPKRLRLILASRTPPALPLERLRAALNPTGHPEFEAVASQGRGVNETLKAACKAMLSRLAAHASAPVGVGGPTAAPRSAAVVPAAPWTPRVPRP